MLGLFHMSDRLHHALGAIDDANARDPTLEAGEPAELVYGRRMSGALAAFAPGASEILQIAVRAQHIERWLNPRRAYPNGKVGYIAWRNAAKRRHAERVGEIMGACGYEDAAIERARALVRKENLRADGEAQTLEDVACLVFLRHYALSFAFEASGSAGARHSRQNPAQDVGPRPHGRARFRPDRAGPRALRACLECRPLTAMPAKAVTQRHRARPLGALVWLPGTANGKSGGAMKSFDPRTEQHAGFDGAVPRSIRPKLTSRIRA